MRDGVCETNDEEAGVSFSSAADAFNKLLLNVHPIVPSDGYLPPSKHELKVSSSGGGRVGALLGL